MRFEPCRADHKSFSGRGTVGPITGWAGGVATTAPHCVRIQVTVDGRRLADIRLPLRRRCR